MDWALEDNMLDGLFFCATLTSKPPSVQAGEETSDISAKVFKPDPCFFF